MTSSDEAYVPEKFDSDSDLHSQNYDDMCRMRKKRKLKQKSTKQEPHLKFQKNCLI
jgi:hypothetical protein